jgi:hypothetical protein
MALVGMVVERGAMEMLRMLPLLVTLQQVRLALLQKYALMPYLAMHQRLPLALSAVALHP